MEYRRDFDVQGKIVGDVRDGMVLRICLYDDKGKLVRYVRQDRKDDERLYLGHPDLITYEESLDPGKEKLKKYSFPELLVKDLNDPEASLHDASIKCFYGGHAYKGIIVSGTDTEHGRVLDTGLDLKDENGDPYDCLKKGDYQLVVTLSDEDGKQLCTTEKKIRIDTRKEVVIVRFNPLEHRKKMVDWCRQMGFSIIIDTLPGYLQPYLGKWFYHMGLLKYYRSNDIAIYAEAFVSMFVYLCDPTSTSYETELAYLGSKGRIGDDHFKAYRYDIGEALVKGREGQIVVFDEPLSLCRIDLVDEECQENVYDIREMHLKDTYYDQKKIRAEAGSRIAVHLIARPRQFDVSDYVLKDDNTFYMENEIAEICYDIDDGNMAGHEDRKLMLKRIDENGTVGLSVFEAYNLFDLKSEDKGKTLKFRAVLKDKKGNVLDGIQEFEIKVI